MLERGIFTEMKKYITNIGICVAAIVLYLGTGLILSLFIHDSVAITALTDIIVSIMGAVYYRKFVYKKDRSVKSDKNTWFNLVWITMIIWIITQVTVTWYYNTFGDSLLDNYNATVTENEELYIILTLFFAPVLEEILMRGVVYPTLKNICKPWIATLISAFVFAIMHGTIVHLVVGMVCGIYFLLSYEYTGKLRYAILSHMVYNFLSIGFSGLSIPEWFFTPWFVIVSNIVLIAMFIKVALYLKETKVKKDMVADV